MKKNEGKTSFCGQGSCRECPVKYSAKCQMKHQPRTRVLHCEVNPLARGMQCTQVGIAVDLGTTCIDLFLWDLEREIQVVSARGENAQRCHGQDVISRIAAANDPGIGLERLQELALGTIHQLIRLCLETCKIKRNAIARVSIAGNTAMALILAKIHPSPLGLYPYKPPVLEVPVSNAQTLGLDIAPKTPVYIFPAASGFIGGDTIAALVALGPFAPDKTSLMVDIGTNGELVLWHKGCFFAASCATGPAFEGAGITWGMPAGDGAIDHMDMDPVSNTFTWHAMGSEKGEKPIGICGSGIVDALAGLVKAKVLSPSGLIDPTSPLVTKTKDGHVQVELVGADRTGHRRPLTVSQKDISEIQLAKAAVCAGVELLMNKAKVDHIDHTILTGAFGAGFDHGKAVTIGMLPKILMKGKITLVAGLVGKGAIMSLIDPKVNARTLELSQKIEVLELGGDSQFQDRFIEAMAFPIDTKKESDELRTDRNGDRS